MPLKQAGENPVLGRAKWEQAQPGRQQAAGGQVGEGDNRCRGWAHKETSSCPESRAQPRQVSWVNALHLNSPGRS